MTPNTMTLDEVRDELARMDGLGPVEEGTFAMCRLRIDDPTDEREFPDPYPATLDGAAAALPKGWRMFQILRTFDALRAPTNQMVPDVRCVAYHTTRLNAHGWSVSAEAHAPEDDELLARYRLALSCRLAEVKQ